jgi:membrane protease YdiL (CAAX protease family)
MAEKLFNRTLSVVGILSIIGFLGISLYILFSSAGLSARKFAAAWLLIYVFAVTLSFKENLRAHKDRLRRFAIEWLITCIVGMLLAAVLLIFG